MAREQRNGERKRRGSAKQRVPDLGHYIIVTDTKQTEKNYLEGIRSSLPNHLQSRIVIHVSKARTESLVEVCKEKAAQCPQYAEPWIVLDRDRVVHFDEIIAKAQAAGIKVGWSNPCIELWFYTYFGSMPAVHDSVICNRKFRECYLRFTGQEYEKADSQIYAMLSQYGSEEAAIAQAKRRHEQYCKSGEDKPSNMCPCTTLYQLIREIRQKEQNA